MNMLFFIKKLDEEFEEKISSKIKIDLSLNYTISLLRNTSLYLSILLLLLISLVTLSLILPAYVSAAPLASISTFPSISNSLNVSEVYYPSNPSIASISIIKYYYDVNEPVEILLDYTIDSSQKIYMEIHSLENPEYFYRYLDVGYTITDSYTNRNKLIFMNDIPGKYIIRLYGVTSSSFSISKNSVISKNLDSDTITTEDVPVEGNILLSQKEFVIYRSNKISDCKIYPSEHPITIDLNSYSDIFRKLNIINVDRLYLSYYDFDGNFISEYRYGDVLNNIIYFSAPRIGNYKLLINDKYITCYSVIDNTLLKENVGENIEMYDTNFNIDLLYTEYPDVAEENPSSVFLSQFLSQFNNNINNRYSESDDYLVPVTGLRSYLEGSMLPDYISYYFTSNPEYFNTLSKKYFEEKDFNSIISKIGRKQKLSDEDSSKLSYLLMQKRLDGKSAISIKGSDGTFQNSFLVLRNDYTRKYFEGTLFDINSENLENGIYQADIYFVNSSVKKMRFNNLDYSNGIELDFEDLELEQLSIDKYSREDFIDIFAINPEKILFEDALVTFTATGNSLWKCEEYNFETRTCYGDFIKILDTIPGREYSFILTPKDPVFAQSSYLINPSFNTNITSGWTTVQESGTPTFAWIASDSGRSGVAQIQATGNNRNWIGSYYQTFNLSIPPGTVFANITFSAYWRISTYTLANPGNIYFWIQNASNNVTSCSFQQSFSSTTSWAQTILQTNGSNNCFLSNFTPNRLYNIRLRCNLLTLGGGGTKDVRCVWDDVNVTVHYTDIQSPVIHFVNDSPDTVNYGNVINFTANVSDNIQIDTVWLSIDTGTGAQNYYMQYVSSSGIYYFDKFNTSIYPDTYAYTLYVNDTSNNTASTIGSFTINDSIKPRINIISPESGVYSGVSQNYFQYIVSEESGIENCSLIVGNQIVSTDYSVERDVLQSLDFIFSDSIHYWNITCYDNSTNNNFNTSITRNLTVDTQSPSVILEYPGDYASVSGRSSRIISLNYTPSDANLENCSLYGNFTGIFSYNRTELNPITGTINEFKIYLNDGTYVWNVLCCDKALNCGSNSYKLHF
jgi:hypothetical protein